MHDDKLDDSQTDMCVCIHITCRWLALHAIWRLSLSTVVCVITILLVTFIRVESLSPPIENTLISSSQ